MKPHLEQTLENTIRADDKITRWKDGVWSEHPRARCACGGIIDAHPTKDASVCLGCGKETDGADAFRITDRVVIDLEEP